MVALDILCPLTRAKKTLVVRLPIITIRGARQVLIEDFVCV